MEGKGAAHNPMEKYYQGGLNLNEAVTPMMTRKRCGELKPVT
jgi:hypothetical protein